jgi:signal transduction histidine kinase
MWAASGPSTAQLDDEARQPRAVSGADIVIIDATWPLESSVEDKAPLPPPWDGDIDLTDDEARTALVGLQFTQPELALEVCRRKFCKAQTAGDEPTALHALYIACSNLYNRSHHELADRAFEFIRQRLHVVTNPRLLTQIKLFHAIRLSEQGELAQAMALRQNALSTAMALGDNVLTLTALTDLVQSAGSFGDAALSLALLEQQQPLLLAEPAYARRSRSHREGMMALAWQTIAANRRLAGDHMAAREALCEARKFAQSSCATGMNDRQVLYALDNLVEITLQLESAEVAHAEVARISANLGMAPSAGTPPWCVLQLALARIDVHENVRTRQALAALTTIERQQHEGSELDLMIGVVQELMLQLHQRSGEHEQALACLERMLGWQQPLRSTDLRQRIKMLRQTVLAMRGEVMEFIAHDLLTPLAAAQTWLQTLQHERVPPSAAMPLREAADRLRKALALSEQYLGVLRAELLPSVDLQVLDIGALTDDVCENVPAQYRLIPRLKRDIDIGTPVLGDRVLLSKAIAALLADAFERAPADTPVYLHLHNNATRGEAVLSIRHEGSGPANAARTRLYQQFADGKVLGADDLGLALAFKVARLHRARLRVHHRPGQGSRICLTMKLDSRAGVVSGGS